MSRSLLLLVVVGVLLSCCTAYSMPTTPWGIQVPKPGGAIKKLSLERIPLPHGVTGAESLAFDRRGQGPYAGVSV